MSKFTSLSVALFSVCLATDTVRHHTLIYWVKNDKLKVLELHKKKICLRKTNKNINPNIVITRIYKTGVYQFSENPSLITRNKPSRMKWKGCLYRVGLINLLPFHLFPPHNQETQTKHSFAI